MATGSHFAPQATALCSHWRMASCLGMATANLRIGAAGWETMFDTIDLRGDGVLDWAEFEAGKVRARAVCMYVRACVCGWVHVHHSSYLLRCPTQQPSIRRISRRIRCGGATHEDAQKKKHRGAGRLVVTSPPQLSHCHTIRLTTPRPPFPLRNT